jgi:hypothetical protein
MLVVFVIARDWMLRAGVRAELRERGIEALGMESPDDAAKALAEGQVPAAVVLEGAASEAQPALENLARRVPVIVVASRIEPVALPSAAVTLHRPVRVQDVVEQVLRVLQGTPA